MTMYKIGYLDTLWVEKEYRGKGIGSSLLDWFEKIRKQR